MTDQPVPPEPPTLGSILRQTYDACVWDFTNNPKSGIKPIAAALLCVVGVITIDFVLGLGLIVAIASLAYIAHWIVQHIPEDELKQLIDYWRPQKY